MNLFAYGTLEDRRMLARLLGRTPAGGVRAVLHGYRRWETTLGYPVILPEPGSSCEGTVYFGLHFPDWERLDLYENVHTVPAPYTRRLVQVQGRHGAINAFTYVGNLNYFRTRLIP